MPNTLHSISPTLPGEDGRYAQYPQAGPGATNAARVSVSSGKQAGDIIHGKAGDWLLQYAPGDYGIVEAAKFAKVYKRVD